MTSFVERPLASRIATVFIAALTALTILSGCDSQESSVNEPPPIELTASEKTLLQESGNTFGFSLLKAVHAENASGENLFLSPFSVSAALNMTVNGARDSTRRAMQQALRVSDRPVAEINTIYEEVVAKLPRLDNTVAFRAANSAWLQNGFPVRESFVDVLKTSYDAEVDSVQFPSHAAVDRINDWVAEKTEGGIDEIITPGMVDDQTRLMLVNAVYFQAAWTTPFDKAKTEQSAFRLPTGASVQVPMMMRESDSLRAYRNERVAIADLPYGNGSFRFTLVVPQGEETVDELIQSLDAPTWTAWVQQLEKQKTVVQMPRFQMTDETDLRTPLTDMGMGVAFQREADFSGISPLRLLIQRARHKATITVDEEGTTASAATSVGVGVTSGPLPVVADRPFLFVIREAQTETVLFAGAVQDPR